MKSQLVLVGVGAWECWEDEGPRHQPWSGDWEEGAAVNQILELRGFRELGEWELSCAEIVRDR